MGTALGFEIPYKQIRKRALPMMSNPCVWEMASDVKDGVARVGREVDSVPAWL